MPDSRIDYEQLFNSVMSRERVMVRVADVGANVVVATELEDGDSLDGVTLAEGDIVLLRNQTDQTENGPWEVQATGAALRPEYFLDDEEARGATFIVEEGTEIGQHFQILASAIIGTDNIAVSQFIIPTTSAVPTKDDKDLAVASVLGSLSAPVDTLLDITNTPANGGMVQVLVNGVSYNVGDGSKTSDPFFFSADGGTTAKPIASIVATDSLFFVRSVAGFRLRPRHRIDFTYDVSA